MTETVRRTVANIKAMCDVSDRIQPYTANCEDITDMISILGHNSKIESIIKWLTDYDVSVPVAVLKEPVPEVTEVSPTESEPTYSTSMFYTPTNLTALAAQLMPNITDITEFNTTDTDEDDDSAPPIEYDKESLNYATYEDLDTATASKVIENYDKQKWLKQDSNAEWKRSEQFPVMVSNSGLFFDLIENKPIIPYWHAGEMFLDVYVDEERLQKRCGAMIAGVFHLKKPPVVAGDPHVIDFKDGDRRNLKLDNLCFTKKSAKPSNTELLINDVCRRCIEYKFSVAKVVSMYTGDDEVEITLDFVKDLINKKQRADISDIYWKLDSHKKPVVKEPKLPAASFVNIADVFLQGEKAENCETLFDAKISGNYDLSDQEKELLCDIAKQALPADNLKFSNIAVYIINNYNWEITADEVKRLMTHPTQLTKIFNERMKETETTTESEAV